MKVVTLNYSGSVGKTMVASHLLAPRMNEAKIFAVESTNESAQDLGLVADQLRGEHFGRLFRELLTLDNAIVDVGASNIEAFLDHLMKYDDSHLEFDYFVLPVIGSGKAQRETITTIETLSELGIEASRIRVIFNRVNADVHDEFPAIFGHQIAYAKFIANESAAVYDNEVFDLLAAAKTTINAVLSDETDYRQLLRETDKSNAAEVSRLANCHALKSLARPVVRNLDLAFSALFAAPAGSTPSTARKRS
ncbi:StbB family protein [Castellaniella sp.]|uniref:StbB family protein n=1 Tax=Castellaniella sp. TaxID=1955812 RepID=UPI002AFE977E|nr:StbB family protein [Castellaniella sp.]